MAPHKKNNFAVWNYFENQNEIGKAVCNICKLVLKNDRSFNLKTHLFKKHQIDLNIKSECLTSSSNSDITSLINARKEHIKVKINKQTLFKSYIGLVTEDSVPFHVLNSPNVKNIIDPICDGLGKMLGKRFRLNDTNCKSTIKKVSGNIREYMKMEMSKRLLSLKIESASRPSGNVIGISAQLIVEDEIKSLILGLVELKAINASATQHLAKEMFTTLEKYDIQLNQIVSITSDNEANMMETIKLLSIYNTREEKKLAGIQICRCAAHTVQLCAMDVTKDPEIEGFVLSCRNFTKFIHKPSNGLEDIFELRNIELPQLGCATKWGSTYDMIHTLLAAKDALIAVEPIGNETIVDNFDNNDFLWDFMDCYITVFAPLQDTLVKFQTERNLHYGNFYAQWLKCKMLTSKIVQRHDTKDLVKKIGNKILESMEKRSSNLLENESLNACLFLDPRFQHTLNFEKRQQAVTYLKHLWERYRSVTDDLEYTTTSYNDPLMGIEDTFEDEAEEMLNTFLTEKLQGSSGDIIDTDVHSKIWNLHLPFLRSDTDVLQFWRDKRHSEPELYALSNVCLGIPPTQLTLEPAFSSLNQMLTANRNGLEHETLEDILLVKLNPIFLSEAINNFPLFEDTENIKDE